MHLGTRLLYAYFRGCLFLWEIATMKSQSVNALGATIAFFLGLQIEKKATMDFLADSGQDRCIGLIYI